MADDGELLLAEAGNGPGPGNSIRQRLLCYSKIEGNQFELYEEFGLLVGDGLEPLDGGADAHPLAIFGDLTETAVHSVKYILAYNSDPFFCCFFHPTLCAARGGGFVLDMEEGLLFYGDVNAVLQTIGCCFLGDLY